MSNRRRKTARDDQRRSLSQNFLIEPQAIARLLAAAGVQPGDLVVDLGAGTGALTRPLVETGACVVAVELDPHWVARLRAIEKRVDNLQVVHADLLEVGLPATPFRVVASPPYHLSTAVVRRLLTLDLPLRDATLVLQRTAARRLATATPTGRFGLTWAPWFKLRVGARLERSSFRPVPASDSAVLTIRSRQIAWLSPAHFGGWAEFLETLFGSPGSSLHERWIHAFGRPSLRSAARLTGIDLDRPPSIVPAKEWVSLYRAHAGHEHWSPTTPEVIRPGRAHARSPN